MSVRSTQVVNSLRLLNYLTKFSIQDLQSLISIVVEQKLREFKGVIRFLVRLEMQQKGPNSHPANIHEDQLKPIERPDHPDDWTIVEDSTSELP